MRDILLAKPIFDFELSVHVSNALERENIYTLGDMVVKTEIDMLRIYNFGRRSLEEVRKILDGLGLSFALAISKDID